MDERALQKQREYRRRTRNAATKRYERTGKGKLMRTYRNMLSRVKGIAPKGRHRYKDLEILNKQEFYEWSLNDTEYNRLYDEWVKSGYDRRLSPSIDRIDTTKGYVLGNMQWLTHSENSRKTCKNKKYAN